MDGIIINSLIAGSATCLGALLVILTGRPRQKTLSFLFGLAAGIMMGVVVLDLIPTALEQGTIRQTVKGFSLGIVLMTALNLVLSRLYAPEKGSAPPQKNYFLRMGYLIAIGIALHDLPEGIAIAAGYSAQQALGLIIALAIGLHNIPEGMATATPLVMSGVRPSRILLLNGAVSLFTPAGALLGLALLNISPHVVALLLAVAAGAMAFIVGHELLPESRRRHPNYSTLGALLGFIFILILSAFH